ncbi:hypothetical protein L6164_028666 [Bauhinia variegata]|uniref:Uncharacterized protein n=1 Tax=Bauhinia variegata TaxID=167791 RepID=A0ACB9L7B9_BAUVA|nr:hypothetical protein L6164_028666 [Bauhinia variegata]
MTSIAGFCFYLLLASVITCSARNMPEGPNPEHDQMTNEYKPPGSKPKHDPRHPRHHPISEMEQITIDYEPPRSHDPHHHGYPPMTEMGLIRNDYGHPRANPKHDPRHRRHPPLITNDKVPMDSNPKQSMPLSSSISGSIQI